MNLTLNIFVVDINIMDLAWITKNIKYHNVFKNSEKNDSNFIKYVLDNKFN